jgi:uncharacterized protein with PQ loop repeat
MNVLRNVSLTLIFLSAMTLVACRDLVPRDVSSLFIPGIQRMEVVGFLAGLGTTFAAAPDLIAMFKRRSTRGMNPRMAAIMGASQILWVYYGLLIASRPVIGWNVVAVVINFVSVAAYRHFTRIEKNEARTSSEWE